MRAERMLRTGVSVNMSAFSATFLAQAAYDPRILLPYSHLGEDHELVGVQPDPLTLGLCHFPSVLHWGDNYQEGIGSFGPVTALQQFITCGCMAGLICEVLEH